MSLERIIHIAKEPFRKLRGKDKLFLHEYWKEFRNFLFFGLIGGIAAYFLAETVIHYFLGELEVKPELHEAITTVKILISILFAVIVGALYLPFYVFIANKFAFTHLYRLRGDNMNPNFRKIILESYEESINEQLIKVATLTKQGEIKADYSTQYHLAHLFSTSARKYFWATSFDKPSEFPIRNISYLKQFDEMQLNGMTENGIPKKARIFITTYSDLIQDIAENSSYLLELLKMHLHYDDKKVICSIKFFVCTTDAFQEIEDIVQTAGIDKQAMIYDFFVIDDELVYGRRNKNLKRTDDEINISFIGNQKLIETKIPIEVSSYKEIFTKIWNKAFDINALASHLSSLTDTSDFAVNATAAVKRLADYQIVGQEKIEKVISRFSIDALNNYQNIENTESRNLRYLELFSTETIGQGFFNKWVEFIKKSKGAAWAVDSSERKEGNEFYRIWDSSSIEDYEYREFFNASIAASKDGQCDFKRIFIVKNHIPKDDLQAFNLFLVKAVLNNKMKIGIIRNTDSNLSDDEKLNFGDFIITDIIYQNGNYSFDKAKGFTLRNLKFKVADLSYTDNLILDKDFGDYQQVFNKLWDNTNTVRFENEADLKNQNKINKLIQT
jgi:hypothetical protein